MRCHPAHFVCLVLPALIALPAAAHNAALPPGTHWLCGLSQELTRIVCVADQDPRDEASPSDDRTRATAATAASTVVVNGTRFPLDPRTHHVVDLWSPPTEAASLELLARATICYRSPGCTVTMNLPAYLNAARR
jgi:hypothetical protein